MSSELIDAEQALAWGLADAVIRDGPQGAGIAAFTGLLGPLRAPSNTK